MCIERCETGIKRVSKAKFGWAKGHTRRKRGVPDTPTAVDFGTRFHRSRELWLLSTGGIKIDRARRKDSLALSEFLLNTLEFGGEAVSRHPSDETLEGIVCGGLGYPVHFSAHSLEG